MVSDANMSGNVSDSIASLCSERAIRALMMSGNILHQCGEGDDLAVQVWEWNAAPIWNVRGGD